MSGPGLNPAASAPAQANFSQIDCTGEGAPRVPEELALQQAARECEGVFGTVVNQGDRTLNKVEVTVFFLDKAGNVVGEEDYHPVLVSEYSIRGNKPLKPNYVEDFGYSVEDDAPSAWAGRAQAKITDIAFAE